MAKSVSPRHLEGDEEDGAWLVMGLTIVEDQQHPFLMTQRGFQEGRHQKRSAQECDRIQ